MLATVPKDNRTPEDTLASDAIAQHVASRMRKRRKDLKLSQAALAQLSGVSLGSLKRFESDYLISLDSLIKLSLVLGCEGDFSGLFSSSTSATTLEDFVAQGHVLLDQIALLGK